MIEVLYTAQILYRYLHGDVEWIDVWHPDLNKRESYSKGSHYVEHQSSTLVVCQATEDSHAQNESKIA